jgi:hypothetical protein
MTKQAKAKFQAELLLAGKTATGIEIPPEVVESLGAGKKPPVAVTINGHTYRSTVASRSGRFLVGVSAENRAAADVAAGDKIEVELELDDKPREVRVPDDLAAALDRDAKAKSFFEELTYSQKKWYVLPIEEAKKQGTRERRLDKALQMLREGRKR